MKKSLHIAIWATLFMVGTTFADGVVPNSAAGVEGDGVFSLTSTAAAGRTYQMTIDSGQLTGFLGQNIIGMQFRLNAGASSWPTANASFASWDIYMGPGANPTVMSNTFASNFTGTITQVRSGALTFTTGSFPSGGSPNVFGPTLSFDTPYMYTGGDLAIEMRFTQQTGATTQSPLDAILASGGPGNGWGVGFSARWTGSYTGTTGANGNFLVTNLLTEAAVPEPSTMILAGASLATVAFWSKRRRARRRKQKAVAHKPDQLAI